MISPARAAHRVKRRITRFIETRLHLKVNEKKSAIRKPLNYEYLGFAFESTYRGWLNYFKPVWCERCTGGFNRSPAAYSITSRKLLINKRLFNN
ncbi:MAG: hypothetical protein V1733_10385 [bacterium]